MNIEELIHDFFKAGYKQNIELYNEFSFQHELGIFLRKNIENKKVQFERNVSHFKFDKRKYLKKEIDISIFNESDLTSVLELKYPRNGQIPETMFSFCKDVAFLEQLVASGFKTAYFVAIVDDPLFYSGKDSGIYGLFRNHIPITGTINKPTGLKNQSINIASSYIANWEPLKNGSKYCVIKINNRH